jgi:hypothetical protein
VNDNLDRKMNVKYGIYEQEYALKKGTKIVEIELAI